MTDLPRILGSVYDGDIEALKGMIEDPAVYEDGRGAALESLLVLVKAGDLERGAVMNYLKTLFKHPVFIDDAFMTNRLIDVCCDLYPQEVYPEIKALFERDAAAFGELDMDWLDSVIETGKEDVLTDRLYENPDYDLIESASDEMGDWICFDGEEYESGLAQHGIPDREDGVSWSRTEPKTGRNEPCPCGSGFKYKKCCGDPAQVLH